MISLHSSPPPPNILKLKIIVAKEINLISTKLQPSYWRLYLTLTFKCTSYLSLAWLSQTLICQENTRALRIRELSHNRSSTKYELKWYCFNTWTTIRGIGYKNRVSNFNPLISRKLVENYNKIQIFALRVYVSLLMIKYHISLITNNV